MRGTGLVVAWAAAAALAAGAAHAQGEPAVTKRGTELRDAPHASGRSLAVLAAQSPVTRLGERRGAWVQVRTPDGATGWLHLFDVGPASGGASTQAPGGGSAATGALRSISNFFSKGSSPPGAGASVSTSTIGIRGLTAEDLAQAQPNAQALAEMERLRQSESQAREFAQKASIHAAAVEPLAAPARPAAAGGQVPGQEQAQ
jgi:hypothetical protein